MNYVLKPFFVICLSGLILGGCDDTEKTEVKQKPVAAIPRTIPQPETIAELESSEFMEDFEFEPTPIIEETVKGDLEGDLTSADEASQEDSDDPIAEWRSRIEKRTLNICPRADRNLKNCKIVDGKVCKDASSFLRCTDNLADIVSPGSIRTGFDWTNSYIEVEYTVGE